MKSGGPWNLRGLRPETRDAARNAARQSGMSVGEWLNNVIQPSDEDDDPLEYADYNDDRNDGWRREPRQDSRTEYRRGSRQEYRVPRGAGGSRHDYYEPPGGGGSASAGRRRSERDREHEREVAREEFGEVHARLDRLSHQLEHLARTDRSRLTGAPARPGQGRSPPIGRPSVGHRTPAPSGKLSVDAAVAEIAERQRALYGGAAAAAAAPDVAMAPLPSPRIPDPAIPVIPPVPAVPAVDISGLEQQLRQITARIEALRPTNELEKVITNLRGDLTEIARQLTEALPRRALESLEIEVHALAQRIDHSRESGVDSTVLAGLERGLAEVHDALRNLTPAENLVGFDDAVKTLAQKVDLIIAKEDPDTLHQLETAIGALRGIVSHVASNDTLTKVAEDVRALAAKVDGLANSTASGHAVEMLEGRLDTLTTALNASTEAGQAVPRELEKMLSGLIEKLEWVQLTHTDHAAVAHLEDRIALLIKRLDASDAKLGNLESVERGLTDLLVHIDQIRGGDGTPAAAAVPKPVVVDTIEREVAEIKRSERRTADSLEAVHGTVEHVVDRLAMIESGLNSDDSLRSIAIAAPAPDPAVAPASPAAAPLPPRSAVARPPLDPNLPPDHPLEPGSAPGTRGVPSAAERIAESEAALGSAKPAAIAPSGGQPNFIAAARRAAQAAAAAPPERSSRFAGAASGAAQPGRLRKLVVAGGAVLIAVGCLHIALRMFQDNGTAVETSSQPAHVAPPSVLPETDSMKPPPLAVAPLPLPLPDADPGPPPATIQIAPPNAAPDVPPSAKPAVAPPAIPGRQSTLRDHTAPSFAPANPPPGGARPVASAIPPGLSTDITGSIPRPAAPQNPAPGPAGSLTAETLPATIGGPVLRAAAMAGDAAAAFEVATRYADGRGVPPSNEQAARWLERAAKQGLAPAQFRLGGLYEKGVGVKKDLATARDFYIAAAEKGNGKAMHNLAVLYAEGINGPADYRDAAHWFREAADRGITDSQYNLAILYARGVGVEQNYAESYKWFLLAANAGDGEAAKKRDEVASHLDSQSLAAAQLAVQKWSAEPQPDNAVTVKAPPGGWDPIAQPAKPKPRSVGAKTAAPETKVN